MLQNPKEKAKQPHKTRRKTKFFKIMNVNNSNSFSVTMDNDIAEYPAKTETPVANV